MLNQRQRPLVLAALGILAIWLLAWGGHRLSANSKMTAERLARYVRSVELNQLTSPARTKAIRELTDKLNALPPDERRQARLQRIAEGWFDQMTDLEKEAFIEATFPAGVKQMLSAFEQLPDNKRKKTIDDALKRLRDARDDMAEDNSAATGTGTNQPPVLSAELEQKVRTIGLKTFFAESSAQTKAEVAPLLEEMQRMMESGGPLRGRRP